MLYGWLRVLQKENSGRLCAGKKPYVQQYGMFPSSSVQQSALGVVAVVVGGGCAACSLQAC